MDLSLGKGSGILIITLIEVGTPTQNDWHHSLDSGLYKDLPLHRLNASRHACINSLLIAPDLGCKVTDSCKGPMS